MIGGNCARGLEKTESTVFSSRDRPRQVNNIFIFFPENEGKRRTKRELLARARRHLSAFLYPSDCRIWKIPPAHRVGKKLSFEKFSKLDVSMVSSRLLSLLA